MGKTNGLVTVEKFKTVTILSINRPSKQNAMNEVLLHELASCLTQFEKDDNASVVVINGIGGNFSVGYDIDELRQTCQYDANAVRNSILVCFPSSLLIIIIQVVILSFFFVCICFSNAVSISAKKW